MNTETQPFSPHQLANAVTPVRVAVVTYVSGRAAGPFGFPARNAAELIVEAIPGSRQDPKILWRDDTKVVGDRIA